MMEGYDSRLAQIVLGSPLTSPVKNPPGSVPHSPLTSPVAKSGDRYIANRLDSNRVVNFRRNLFGGDGGPGGSRQSPHHPRKHPDTDNSKDVLAYNCLLKNELLGANITDLREVSEDRPRVLVPHTRPGVFNYSSQLSANTVVSPFSLAPLSNASHELLRSPRKAVRKISKVPFKVLDAPDLQDDFYLNLVDWSSSNVLAVGLGPCVYLWSACNSMVTKLCDLSLETDTVTSVSWNERGQYVAVGTNKGYTQIWEASVEKKLASFQYHKGRVGALAWNQDQLSSGSRDRMIIQKDIKAPPDAPEHHLHGHRQEVCGLKWSPDQQHLASGGNDNKLFVWNKFNYHSAQTPQQQYTDHLAAVKAIAWSPHHHGLLASGGGTADRCIRFWNTLTGQPLQCVDTGSQVCNLAWSKHASELVSTHGYSQNQILVWKYPSLTQVAKLTGHTSRVLYLALSPDGESIVTGAGDETLRFWNVFTKIRSHKETKSLLNMYTTLR